jgi:hypothetical protein
MSMELLKEKFVPKYKAVGEPNKFYRFLLFYALNKMVLMEQGFLKEISPDVAFLDCHDQFIILYRKEGEQYYLDMARAFRRAGHKIYRAMRRKNMIPYNPRFLNLV